MHEDTSLLSAFWVIVGCKSILSMFDYKHVCWILICRHTILLALATKQYANCVQHAMVFAVVKISEHKREWTKSIWHCLWYAVMQCSICRSISFFIFLWAQFDLAQLTSTHVAIVWFITRPAAAAANGYHPLSVTVTVKLYGHVYFLSVGDTTSSSDD